MPRVLFQNPCKLGIQTKSFYGLVWQSQYENAKISLFGFEVTTVFKTKIMLQKQYTKLLNTPILNRQTGEEVGEIYDLIIDPDTGKIEAFWVKQGLLSGAEKVLSINDVTEWKLRLYIDDNDSIVNPNEILKIQKILKKEIHLYLHKVKTLSGSKLGRAIDLFLDSMSGQILQIQVAKNFFGFKYSKRLVRFSEIYEINKNAIVLKNDYKYTPLKIKEVLDLKVEEVPSN